MRWRGGRSRDREAGSAGHSGLVFALGEECSSVLSKAKAVERPCDGLNSKHLPRKGGIFSSKQRRLV